MRKILLLIIFFSNILYAQRKSQLDSIRLQMQFAAKQEMLDKYYPRNIDTLYGGYLSTFSFDFRPVGSQDKMIVTQSRHVWSTAESALFYKDTAYISMARNGYYFLRDKMWDHEFGGFFNLVDRKGSPKSTIKEAYGNAFGIYALSSFYRCSGDKQALELAKKTFDWLEKHSHDPKLKGYFQHMERNGQPIKRGNKVPSTSDLGYKDQNSSIHLLEAFTALYKVWPDTLLRKRLQEMLFLIRDKMVDSKGNLQLFFTPDWKPVSFRDSSRASVMRHRNLDHISSGHDVETAFLMSEASEALGLHDDKTTHTVGKRMLDVSLNNSWDDKNGGFFDEGYYFKHASAITITKDSKNWWAQAEGLNTLLIFANKYPADKMRYFEKFLKLWAYVQTYLIDHENGDWYEGGLDKEPEKRTSNKAHIWKGTYHNFRSLSNCIQLLETMARSAK